MPSGTLFNPQNISQFEKSKLNKNAKGVAMTVNMYTTTNIDLAVTDDSLIATGSLLVKNGTKGDYVEFFVMSGETPLIQFISTWYINPDATDQSVPRSTYPAKIIAGLTLRAIYHSTSAALAPWVAINYDIDKVLV